MNCPICESKIDDITRLQKFRNPETEGIKHYFCDECNVEFYVYPKSNKEGVQMTGWYAHIPLKNFPKDLWQHFLLTERNIYGEEMPERLSVYSDIDRETERRKKRREEIEEWEKRVG